MMEYYKRMRKNEEAKKIDEGYIKYQCNWIDTPSVSAQEIIELNQWRERLYQLGLIGQYENGVGFGNISIRAPLKDTKRDHPNRPNFIISGTQTGGMTHLTEADYTKIVDFDWWKNLVVCRGLIKASSETLTHAAIYCANPEINAVIHIHHLQLWQQLIDRVSTTNYNCAYGTPEMATEIFRLCQQDTAKKQKIVIMSGHPQGILTFGPNLSEAAAVLLNYLNRDYFG